MSYQTRVNLGVQLLDHTIPNWEHKIDLEELDIGSEEDCVLGQLYDNSFVGLNDLFGFGASFDEVIELGRICGFYNENHDEYELLTEVWVNVINELLN